MTSGRIESARFDELSTSRSWNVVFSQTRGSSCCSVRRLGERLVRELSDDVHTRVQSPLALSDDSEPEPDIAVVPAGDYANAHPTRALLVIEIADTSLQKDRGIKTALYATAGIPEFWLVNLTEKIVEVHREPSSGRYADIQRVGTGGRLTALAFPMLTILVSDVF
ncbi:MAG: Uma2 family endonuclease [Acidobacteria bacterium]|nr:MAG: Uma2 family endonuclease [Acidobacteriota bacterium]